MNPMFDMKEVEFKITHKRAVQIAYRWMLKNCSVGVAFMELKCMADEIPDVIGFGANGHSVLIEVKVSRADFLQDKHKPFRRDPVKGMGSQRYYACPAGMIRPGELPDGWGLVWIFPDGKARTRHQPYKGNIGERTETMQKNMQAEQDIMYSALRRLFIKGFVKHIYDKEYNRSTTADELLKLNHPQIDLFNQNK